MRIRHILPLALLASGCFAGAASAGGLTGAVILKDFNAVVFTNGSTTSDIEGAAVIGGNFSGATVYNNPVSTPPAGFGALTVFGSTSGNSINIDNGGSAYVAGTKGAGVNFNGGGGYIGAPGATITDFSTPLTALSTQLSTLAATGTMPTPNNNEVITAVPGAGGVAVFDLSAADLSAIPSYNIDLNGASSVIFNVSGTNISFNANDESGVTGANDIIWNFYQATSVNLGQTPGTVLAPLATVTNNNQIDGTLVAKSWNGQGEVHSWGFTGALPPGGVPEPATWAMLLLGIGALGVALRRARAAGALALG